MKNCESSAFRSMCASKRGEIWLRTLGGIAMKRLALC
jgi:hypothetical protein